jgi:hypothetical protein
MSEVIRPEILFDLIAYHLPASLRPHVMLAGSLAAAYHHRDQLIGGVVNTKDADVMIHPAGAIAECAAIAARLIEQGWRRIDKCYPRKTPKPTDSTDPDEWLMAIRLSPKDSDAYFLELLAFPQEGQQEIKRWEPCQLDDGWYGLPCFRYLGLTEFERQTAANGIAYAAPRMMALANLLSHPTLRPDVVIKQKEEGRTIMRAAKDIGRVLALAWLSDADTVRSWADSWRTALARRFPGEHVELGRRAGDGLRALLADADALDQARHSVVTGLLSGHDLTTDNLRVVGKQLLELAIDPLRRDR